jgi:hypothetical protein
MVSDVTFGVYMPRDMLICTTKTQAHVLEGKIILFINRFLLMDIVSVIHISLCSIIVFSDQNVERNYSA